MHSCADAGSSMGREYDSSRVTGNWSEDDRRGGWVGWAVRASTEMTVASRVMKRRAQPYEGENAFQRSCPSSCTNRFGDSHGQPSRDTRAPVSKSRLSQIAVIFQARLSDEGSLEHK